MSTDPVGNGEASAALAAVCSLAARLLLVELDEALLRVLGEPETAESLEALAPGCRAQLARADWDDAALDALAAEYCSLFLLPGGVAPYAAAWAEGDPALARAALTDEIRALHGLLGVEAVPHGPSRVPADHLGMLLALAAVAIERDALETAQRIFALCAPWGPRVAERTREHASTPVYRALAGLVEQALGAGQAQVWSPDVQARAVT